MSHEIAVLEDVGKMNVRLEPIPVPGKDEVLVHVTHAGVCGSDLHYFRHGGLGSFKTPLPMYMGHEPAGIVVNANGVEGFHEGDRVAIEPGCPCLTSKWSLLGKHNLCEKGTFMGANNTPGCFASYACVNKIQLCKIPENVDCALASLCEPLGVALHTYKLCGARTLDLISGRVAIFGGGAIGLCHLLILKARGVRDVYVVEKLPFRRALALELGAIAVEDYKSIGKCELVIDCAGTSESFDACVRVAAVNGTVALVGIPEVDYLNFNPHQARTKELVVINVRRSNQCLHSCLQMLAESPDMASKCRKLITHEFPLCDIQRAFEMASEYRDCLKIIIRPPPVRNVKRIGFLGISAYGMGYLKHLLSDPSYEVVYCTAKSKKKGHSDALEDELKTLCEVRGIPYLGNINVNKEFPPYDGVDLVLLGGYDAILREDFLTRGAKYGVVNTHFGLIPLNRGCNPSMWAVLKNLPQGFTTYFCNKEIDLPDDDAVIDMQRVDGDFDSGEAYDVMCARAVERLPKVLEAIRSGITLPHPPVDGGVNYHDKRLPNDSYVSWHWRPEFLQRFSDSQRFGTYPVVRTECGSWFKVINTRPWNGPEGVPGQVVSPSEVLCGPGPVATHAAECVFDAPVLVGAVFESKTHDIDAHFDGTCLPSQPPNVPIFRLDFEDADVARIQDGVKDILTSGRPLSNGKYTKDFECAFKDLIGARHALAVNNGTSALEVAMRALDLGGKTVITPSNTFFATQVAVQNAGGRVAFVDVERQYMQICPLALERALETTPDVGAVILVHIGGIISPHHAEIRRLCDARGVYLIEDAAHAHLAHSGTAHAGTIGHVAAFSFFPTKVMTAGEAGMVTTDSESLYETMLSIREFGRQIRNASGSRLVQVRVDGGVNGKISEMTALLGLVECGRVSRRIERRRVLVDMYANKLDSSSYEVVKQEGASYYKCIVHVKREGVRDALRDYAQAHGVSFTGEVYFKGVHEMPAYEEHATSLPNTEYACANHVCPPLYPELTEEEVERVCSVMNAFLNSSGTVSKMA